MEKISANCFTLCKMPQPQKRFTISLPKNLYEFLEQWAEKEGRNASNLAAFLVMEGIREKQGDPDIVRIDLSSLHEKLENFRSDSAWKALSLSQKALLLLQEYFELIEKQNNKSDKKH